MKAMTELDVLKGLQSSICGLDLDAPQDIYGLWPVERALALGAAMEASAGRIISARCPVTQAWNAICAEPVDDLINDLEIEVHFAELMAPGIAERNAVAEAKQIDHSHPEIFGPILGILRGV